MQKGPPRTSPTRRSLLTAAAAAPAAGLLGLRGLHGITAAQEPGAPVSVYASGLYNPRGLTFGPDGALYVVLGGTGEPGQAPSVVKIENGCPVTVAHGLPSTRGMSGAVQGPGSVAFLGEQLYILQDSQDDRGDLLSTQPNGVYKLEADGSASLLADVSTWMNENPTREIPGDRGKLGETFAMLAGDGFLWVIESNCGQVLKVGTDGSITRGADLFEGHPVPTSCAAAPDGGLYVGNLTDAPYPQAAARVVHVKADGSVEDVWTGLTMVVALAVVDGTLYACEMSTGNLTQPPFTRPGAGRIVRQQGPATLREVVSALEFPIGMTAGPDGMLYVSTPALGSDGAAGAVLRIDPAANYLTPPANLYDDAACPGFQAARADLLQAFARINAQVSKPAPATSATPPANTVEITIKDFKYDPPTITFDAGRAVSWINRDPVAHTATATDKSFDSGNLNQDQTWFTTFDKAGTYEYICTYHPYMKGTVVVE
ncbi:MAG: ScyD/ScyE family protein [Chloroflexota bacterium]